MMYVALVGAICTAGAMMAADTYAIPWYVWAGLGAVSFLGMMKLRQRRLVFACMIILCLASLGALRMLWEGRQYDELPHYVSSGEVIVEGQIVSQKRSFPTEKGTMVRYVVAAERLGFAEDGVLRETSGKLYVTIPGDPLYEPTERVTFQGVVKPIRYYRNRGVYDALHRDKEQQIFLKAYSDDKKSMMSTGPPQGWRYRLYQWREATTAWFKTVLASDDAHILSSLLFGGHYEDLPPSVVESFSITGLIHILSVSGSHMALLLSVVQLCGTRLGLRQTALFVLSVGFVVVYSAAAEFTAPVIRSAMMGLIAAYSLTAEREYVSYQALGIAMLSMLWYSPYLVYDISFQLSCGASAGILLFQPKISQYLRWLPVFLRQTVGVCISAQLLVLPLICANFFALPVYTILANLLVGPVLDMVIVLGLGAVVTGAVLPFVGELILQVIEPILTLAVTGNQWLSSLPGSRYWLGALPFGYILSWYGAVGAVFGPSSYRRVLLSGAVLIAVLSTAWAWRHQPEAKVFVFDMGNDRATCVTFPDKTSYLWYNKSEWSNPEQALVVLTPALRYAGIFQLTQCTVTGHEPEETGRQLEEAFHLEQPVRYETQAVRQEMVFRGTIPYTLYGTGETVSGKSTGCIEIWETGPFRESHFPHGSAALILHRQGGRTTEHDASWLEQAEFLGIPVFSPQWDGQIEGTYTKGAWTFTTYGGDKARWRQ